MANKLSWYSKAKTPKQIKTLSKPWVIRWCISCATVWITVSSCRRCVLLRVGGESVGLLVDAFHQTVDIILKPMTGLLGSLSGYAGSALMGDGSVLMVLDVKELI